MKMPSSRSNVTRNGLLISKVRNEDNGVYICKASNSIGEITAVVYLHVNNLPSKFSFTLGEYNNALFKFQLFVYLNAFVCKKPKHAQIPPRVAL